MMCRQGLPATRQLGVSLIELMVAIVLGLIVIGALVTFVISSITSYGDGTKMTRLTQDLRAGMSLVVRDIRRAGYDDEAVKSAMTSKPTSAYLNLVVKEANAGCMAYTYDRGGAGSDRKSVV